MVTRVGSVIGLKEEKFEEYKKAHQNVWPEILKIIHDCNIRNYSIYYKDGMLFSYYEYVGDNFEEDMKRWRSPEVCKEWDKGMVPMQVPFETRKEGEWWAGMEEVFHTD